VVVGGVVGGWLYFAPAPHAQTPPSPLLFDNGPETSTFRTSGLARRSRRVGLNLALLDSLASGGSRSVRLNVFDNVVLDADRMRVDKMAGGSVWVGQLRDQSGTVHLSMVGNALHGRIESRDGLFMVSSDADGTPIVEELDPSLFPADFGDDAVTPNQLPALLNAAPAGPIAAADNGTLIDVMILYTPAARAAAGGTGNMQALVNNAVSVTNTAYANSGVKPRLRLAYSAEIAYTESGDWNTDLNRLTYSAGSVDDPSGYMDVVTQPGTGLRDTYGADMVQLLTATAGTTAGIGWLNSNSAAYADLAFSVVNWSAAVSNLTTAHEFGHNQGLKHAHEEAASDGTGYGLVAYGYKYYSGASSGWFRTIMAYDCPSPGCVRIGRFSNPSAAYNYNGIPTGVGGTGTNAADNVTALNGTAVTVANWRQSKVATPTATHTATATARATATSTPRPRATAMPLATTNFYTVTPCRVVDTRLANGPYGGPALLANTDRVFVVAGVCGVPATAKAVSINATIVQPATTGDLRLFPAGQTVPPTSVINFGASQAPRANNAVIALNAGGQLSVHDDQAPGATVHFILDVSGYFE
jgi:hypothetical protein